MMSHAAPPPHHPYERRSSSVVERAIRSRRSFRDILVRAASLDCSHGDASSAEAIACYFLRRQQGSLQSYLSEQQLAQRVGLRKLINLLCSSSDCSWNASLLCGSLYKSILDATRSIARVQSIVEASSPSSQVGDLLLPLTELQDLFSEKTLKEIEDVKDLFIELDCKIKDYQRRLRIQALSRMRSFKRGLHHGVTRYRHAMREAKAYLSNSFIACTTGISDVSTSDGKELLTDVANDYDDDDDVATDTNVIAHRPVVLKESEKPESSHFIGLNPLQKAQVRLLKLETEMHVINLMLDNLKCMVKDTHNQTLNPWYIESLKNEPLMFYGVAEQILVCHGRLSKHLEDLRDDLLICFCFINSARDLVCTM